MKMLSCLKTLILLSNVYRFVLKCLEQCYAVNRTVYELLVLILGTIGWVNSKRDCYKIMHFLSSCFFFILSESFFDTKFLESFKSFSATHP